jgi:hypothetical protein
MNIKYGNIYKISCNDTDKIYIGSTSQNLNSRLSQHKYFYNQYLNGKNIYYSSFEILKNNNYEIHLIEKCPLNELKIKEKFYIKYLINVVNKNIPSRKIKEYYLDNIINYKQYYQQIKNNDRFKMLHMCPCGTCYSLNNKQHHLNTLKHKKIMSTIFNNINETPSPPSP